MIPYQKPEITRIDFETEAITDEIIGGETGTTSSAVTPPDDDEWV